MRLSLPIALAFLTASCAGGGRPADPHRFAGRERSADAEPRYLFISPMGEPFRGEHPERAWFAAADTDHDGRITPAEFRADAARFFRVLDRQHDGEIDPADIDYYETVLAPEIRVRDGGGSTAARSGTGGGRGRSGGGGGRGPGGGFGGGGGGGGGFGGGMGRRGGRGSDGDQASGAAARPRPVREGAARYGYLDLPEPVTAADANLNRGVDANEFERAADERFALLDRHHDGALTASELPAIDTRLKGGRGGPARGGMPDRRPPGVAGERRDQDD